MLTPSRSTAVELVSRKVSDDMRACIATLAEIALQRGQSLAQPVIAWTLRDSRVTSALMGASSVAQLETNGAAARRTDVDADELAEIDRHATDAGIDLWKASRQSG